MVKNNSKSIRVRKNGHKCTFLPSVVFSIPYYRTFCNRRHRIHYLWTPSHKKKTYRPIKNLDDNAPRLVWCIRHAHAHVLFCTVRSFFYVLEFWASKCDIFNTIVGSAITRQNFDITFWACIRINDNSLYMKMKIF
jgi:hypothetical protein